VCPAASSVQQFGEDWKYGPEFLHQVVAAFTSGALFRQGICWWGRRFASWRSEPCRCVIAARRPRRTPREPQKGSGVRS
jgi:hypothetical protein